MLAVIDDEEQWRTNIRLALELKLKLPRHEVIEYQSLPDVSDVVGFDYLICDNRFKDDLRAGERFLIDLSRSKFDGSVVLFSAFLDQASKERMERINVRTLDKKNGVKGLVSMFC